MSIIVFLSKRLLKQELEVHGLSHQGTWASFSHPNPQKLTLRTSTYVSADFFLNVNLKHVIEYFHLNIIHMTLYKDIMLYFDKFTVEI